MAHKLSAFHHLPHGVANALLITDIMRYNIADAPPENGHFLPVSVPERSAPLLRVCKIRGRERQHGRRSIRKLPCEDRGTESTGGHQKTIRDYGVTEEAFLATLDDMCEQAFDDQCTGANPVIR